MKTRSEGAAPEDEKDDIKTPPPEEPAEAEPMKCAACGAEVQETEPPAKFCSQCGAKLGTPEDLSPEEKALCQARGWSETKFAATKRRLFPKG